MQCSPQPACRRRFQAVEIDGEAYWDGGYMGNPSLFPLIYSGAPRDVLLVILNPIHREGVPKRAGEIQDRINEISFQRLSDWRAARDCLCPEASG